MKKILKALFLVILLTPVFLFSQTVAPPGYAAIDTNYRTYANNIFGLLEPNRISTGLLVDYGFDFTDPTSQAGFLCRE